MGIKRLQSTDLHWEMGMKNNIYQEIQFIASHSDSKARSLSKQWQKGDSSN